MNEQPYVSLIIPAYNEVRQIAHTVREAQEFFNRLHYPYEIIVSADGNDGTREVVAGLAQADPWLRVIGTVERHGKGHGIREAVRQARGRIIGFADADNKTPIAEFGKVDPLLRLGTEVVIGSRGIRGAKIERYQPLHRRLGSRGFAIFMHLVVGLPDIVDTQCGFKFFQGYVAKDLFARQQIDGYMFDVEILYLARQSGYRIAQVPVRWHDDGDSRLQLVRGNLQNGLDVIMMRLRHLHSAERPATIESPLLREPSVSADD